MKTVSAEFTIVEGQEQALMAGVDDLLQDVSKLEDGTWLYLANTRTDTDTGKKYLLMIEGYASKEAFKKHLAPGAPWSVFASQAKKKGWLVLDPGSVTGFDVSFHELDLRGSLLRTSGTVGF